MAPPTPAWGQLQWDQTDSRSRRWAVSAPMAAQGWAARPQGWVQCLTIKS